jgi:hypothetical protein
MARSNSANTPSIWNMARPDGVVVSRDLLVQEQIDALGVEVRQERQQIGERPANPVHHPGSRRHHAGWQKRASARAAVLLLDRGWGKPG